MTTMFDDQGQVVQWYIDICKIQGLTDQQVPWFDDLFLDIVVLPTGEKLLLDEDELEEALEEGEITPRDSAMARKTAARLMDLIKQNKFPYFDLSLQHRRMLLNKLGWDKSPI